MWVAVQQDSTSLLPSSSSKDVSSCSVPLFLSGPVVVVQFFPSGLRCQQVTELSPCWPLSHQQSPTGLSPWMMLWVRTPARPHPGSSAPPCLEARASSIPKGSAIRKPQDRRTKVAPSLVLPWPRGALGLQLPGWEPPRALLGALDEAVLAGLWVLFRNKGDGLWYRVMAAR